MNEILTEPTSKITELRATKESLGPLVVDTIQANSFSEAHFTLAKQLSPQIQKLAKIKTEDTKPKDKKITAKCWEKIKAKQQELQATKPQIASLIGEYIASIEAWAKGAEITLEEALLLQNDNVGCQTFAIRGNNNEIFIGHTEEEINDERIDKARWLTFKVADQERQAFIYPDLLPGPAFSFANGCFMAVDALFCLASNKQKKEGGFLANAAVWMLWRSGDQELAEEIIQSVGPFYDGYAINLLYLDQGKPTAKTLEFIGESPAIVRKLGEQIGDTNIQVNCSSVGAIKDLRPYEDLDEKDINGLNNRTRIIDRALGLTQKITQVKDKGFSPEIIRRILSFKLGDEDWPSLAAPFSRGHVSGQLSQTGFEMLIDSGPALKRESPYQFRWKANP